MKFKFFTPFILVLSLTLTRTPEVSAVPLGMVVEVRGESRIVRRGPQSIDDVITVVADGTRLILLGPSNEAGWLQVRTESMELGYISEAHAAVKTADASDIPASFMPPPRSFRKYKLPEVNIPESRMPRGSIPYEYNGGIYYFVPLNSGAIEESSTAE